MSRKTKGRTNLFNSSTVEFPFPELMDEPNAPSLPSAEVMWSYYRRELPLETLREYDVNCVRFRSWQKARADMAKQRLVEAKQRGELVEED